MDLNTWHSITQLFRKEGKIDSTKTLYCDVINRPDVP